MAKKKDSDMRRARGVVRRAGTQHYWFQRKLPDDLKASYGGRTWAAQESLKTANLAEANRRATRLWSELDNEFDQRRQKTHDDSSNGQDEPIPSEFAQWLAGRIEHDVLLTDEQMRRGLAVAAARQAGVELGGSRLSGMPPVLFDAFRSRNKHSLDELLKQRASGDLEPTLDYVNELLEGIGGAYSENTPGIQEALHQVLDRLVIAAGVRVQRDAGQVIPTPPEPPDTPPGTENNRRLRDVLARWEESTTAGHDWIGKVRQAVKVYEQQTGDPPIKQLRRDQGEAFLSWLRKQPGASKTKHNLMNALKTLFNYAARDLEWMTRNPWVGFDVDHETENKRGTWTDAVVSSFFSRPLWNRYDLPNANAKNGGPASYWLPLLALFTGARPDELVQLRVSDVREEQGIPYLSINDEDDKTLKNKASRRNIPLHSELLRLGFLEFVRDMHEGGEMSLWPRLTLYPRRKSGYFSTWFGEERRKHSAEVPDLYSLRHTVSSKIGNVRPPFPDHVRQRLSGHAVKGILNKTYTHAEWTELKEAVEAVQYDGLVLPRVYPPR